MLFRFSNYNPFEVETSETDRLTALLVFMVDNFDGAGKSTPFTEYLYHLLNNATEKEGGCKYFTEEGVHICRQMDWLDEVDAWFDDAYDRHWMW